MIDTYPVIDALRERLARRPSKASNLLLAREAIIDSEQLKALFWFVYNGDVPLRWRAAWAISKVSEQYPSMIAGERRRLIQEIMDSTTSDGLRRLLLSICYNIPDAEELDVEFYNFLLDRTVCLHSSPGVQALSIKLAARMSRTDVALYKEFLCIIRNMELAYYSAGVRAAVRNCLRNSK